MGKHKDKFGKTRLGMFLQKAGKIVPEVLDVATDFVPGGSVKNVVKTVSNILDSKKGESKEISELSEEFALSKLEMELEAYS